MVEVRRRGGTRGKGTEHKDVNRKEERRRRVGGGGVKGGEGGYMQRVAVV